MSLSKVKVNLNPKRQKRGSLKKEGNFWEQEILIISTLDHRRVSSLALGQWAWGDNRMRGHRSGQ